VVHVESSLRSREDEAEDRWVDATGCIEPFYPYFAVSMVLDPRDNLVFWMGLQIGPKGVEAAYHFSVFISHFLE
jgi:hypothetical protein